jgi:hypothetical protein
VWAWGAAWLAAGLFLIFSIAQASLLVRGISADCGCFAPGERVGWVSLLRTVGLGAGAVFCLIPLRGQIAVSQEIPASSEASLA